MEPQILFTIYVTVRLPAQKLCDSVNVKCYLFIFVPAAGKRNA